MVKKWFTTILLLLLYQIAMAGSPSPMPQALERSRGEAPGDVQWNEWSRHVLIELQRLNAEICALKADVSAKQDLITNKMDEMEEKLNIRLERHSSEISSIDAKISLYSSASGIAGGTIVSIPLFYFLRRNKKDNGR